MIEFFKKIAKWIEKRLNIIVIIAFIVAGLGAMMIASSVKELKSKVYEDITYTQAQNYIADGSIKLVIVDAVSGTAELYPNSNEIKVIYVVNIPDLQTFSNYMYEERRHGNEVDYSISRDSIKNSAIFDTIKSIIPDIIIIAILIYVGRKFVGMLNDNDELMDESFKDENGERHYTFSDVAGIDQELQEVTELVEILKNPSAYTKVGAKIPKGALLIGPPGTGKTLIAKAIAGEAGVPFYNCTGSSFENKYVGVGAAKVRSLFEKAKENAPCVIFIDEFDSIAKERYSESNYSEQTLNQLLTEMDGFSETSGVLIIAATNHEEVLDPAIMRRFGRVIHIDLPDKAARLEILRVHSKGKSFGANEEKILRELSEKTSGMSGAALENILNEAAIMAVRNAHTEITSNDVDEAFVKVILGVSKGDKEISEDEKWLTAIHEAGHALAGRFFKPNKRILQISIIPRGTAGGYTIFEDEENYLPFKADLYNQMMISLGGRAAEEIEFGSVSVGASSDLKETSEIAHSMVYSYAMGENSKLVRLYSQKEYNSMLEKKMLPDMENLVDAAYEEVKEKIKDNIDVLHAIAKMLIWKSTLNAEETSAIFSEFNI